MLLNKVVGDQNKNFSSQIGPDIKLLATKMKNPGASWPLKNYLCVEPCGNLGFVGSLAFAIHGEMRMFKQNAGVNMSG